jgi:hypothetical protein
MQAFGTVIYKSFMSFICHLYGWFIGYLKNLYQLQRLLNVDSANVAEVCEPCKDGEEVLISLFKSMRFEALTAVLLKIPVFWDHLQGILTELS